MPLGIDVAVYMAFGVLNFAFFAWLLRKPQTLPLLVAVGAIFWTAGSVILLWKFSSLATLLSKVFAVFSVLTVVVFNVRNCMEPIPAAKNIAALEITTMFFVFFLWVQDFYGWPFSYVAPLLAASLLSASAVIVQRLSTVNGTGGRGRWRGTAVVAVMLVVIGLLLLLFVRYGAGPLGQGVVMLCYGMLFCLKLVWRFLNFLLYWLASLFPDVSGELMAEPAPEIVVTDEMTEELQLPPWVLAVLGAVGICIIAAVLIYLLFRLRKLRLGGKTVGVAGGIVERKRPSFSSWLRRVWAALCERVRFLYVTIVMRGSLQELYLYLKRAGRRLDCRQKPGETPCAFVRRAARATEGTAGPELSPALEELARALGACLYAPVAPPPLPGETARCIRRSFARALKKVRREKLRRLFAEKLSEKKNKTAEPS